MRAQNAVYGRARSTTDVVPRRAMAASTIDRRLSLWRAREGIEVVRARDAASGMTGCPVALPLQWRGSLNGRRFSPWSGPCPTIVDRLLGSCTGAGVSLLVLLGVKRTKSGGVQPGGLVSTSTVWVIASWNCSGCSKMGRWPEVSSTMSCLWGASSISNHSAASSARPRAS